MASNERAELADLFVELVAEEQRSHPLDRFRLGSESGMTWVGTIEDVEQFRDSLDELLGEARDMRRREGRP